MHEITALNMSLNWSHHHQIAGFSHWFPEATHLGQTCPGVKEHHHSWLSGFAKKLEADLPAKRYKIGPTVIESKTRLDGFSIHWREDGDPVHPLRIHVSVEHDFGNGQVVKEAIEDFPLPADLDAEFRTWAVAHHAEHRQALQLTARPAGHPSISTL